MLAQLTGMVTLSDPVVRATAFLEGDMPLAPFAYDAINKILKLNEFESDPQLLNPIGDHGFL